MIETLLSLDTSLLLWIQSTLRTPILDVFFSLYTQLGNVGLVWIVLSLVMVIFKRTRKVGLAGLFALLCSLLFTNCLLKPLISRDRPWVSIADYIPLLYSSDSHSFPSGHTSASFAAAVAWYKMAPDKGWCKVAIGGAILMGFSRLYVGVHYPTDVLGGVIIGILAALCGVAIYKKLANQFSILT